MLQFGEVIDEAAEQAGLDPAALTHRHLNSLSRSFMLLMTEIENKGARPEYRMETISFTIDKGQGAIILPEDTVDVTDVSIGETQFGVTSDIQITRTHRQDYLRLSNKTTTGRPTAYWVSKSLPTEIDFLRPHASAAWGQGVIGGGLWGGGSGSGSGANVPTDAKAIILWPINDQDGLRVTVNRLRYTGQPDNLASTVDARRNWLDTICAGLAARCAQKYNIARFPDLKSIYERLLSDRLQSEDRHPVYVAFRAHGFSRRRRH